MPVEREIFANLALVVPVLIPAFMLWFVIMPIIYENDNPEYNLSKEARQFRRTNRRIMNLGVGSALILSTLTIAATAFGI